MLRIISAVTKRIVRLLPIGLLRTIHMHSARALGYGSGGATSHKDEAVALARFLTCRTPNVVDGGANIGEWTNSFLRIVGSEPASLILIEPLPEHAHTLKERFRNGNTEVIQAALDRSDGATTIHFDPDRSTLSSVYKRDLTHLNLELRRSVEVDSLTVDTLMARRSIDILHVLKLDVEGHELSVLRGATSALREGRIRTITFEFGGCNIDSKTYFRDFWNYLTPIGYTFFRVVPGGGVIRIERYSEREECFLTTNYIASLDKRRW